MFLALLAFVDISVLGQRLENDCTGARGNSLPVFVIKLYWHPLSLAGYTECLDVLLTIGWTETAEGKMEPLNRTNHTLSLHLCVFIFTVRDRVWIPHTLKTKQKNKLESVIFLRPLKEPKAPGEVAFLDGNHMPADTVHGDFHSHVEDSDWSVGSLSALTGGC